MALTASRHRPRRLYAEEGEIIAKSLFTMPMVYRDCKALNGGHSHARTLSVRSHLCSKRGEWASSFRLLPAVSGGCRQHEERDLERNPKTRPSRARLKIQQLEYTKSERFETAHMRPCVSISERGRGGAGGSSGGKLLRKVQ